MNFDNTAGCHGKKIQIYQNIDRHAENENIVQNSPESKNYSI